MRDLVRTIVDVMKEPAHKPSKLVYLGDSYALRKSEAAPLMVRLFRPIKWAMSKEVSS